MKTTTASADPKSFHKLQELVRDIDVAMVTTVTPDGALRSRPMATRKFDDDGVIWFFTSDESGMAHDLEGEHAVNVSYADSKRNRYVSVTGNASFVRDRAKAEDLWDSHLKTYFPAGLDDPNVALLAVRVATAEYWDAPRSKMVQLLAATQAAPRGEAPELGEHRKVEIRAAQASG
jgi:general stress protein 26